jgi:UDP:flavonoid glycosyltransferase YjiC (YdhE family)
MKRVLIAPLDWGLGHATRCIPIINALLQRHCEVMIAGSGDSLQLLAAEFPGLTHFTIAGYSPAYPRSGAMVWKMAAQVPKFMRTIAQEHRHIEQLVSRHRIDLVISDNRYGCWSRQVPSVFITHQSNIMMPQTFGWLQPWVRAMNIRHMRKFTRCWIPDYPDGHSLAGRLIAFGTVKPPLQVDYTGTLSRFSDEPPAKENILYDVAAIFSGPEPQRSLLEHIVMPQLEQSGLRYFVVRGLPSATPHTGDHIAGFLTSKDLLPLIRSSHTIIARSGYSTVMDMAALHKKVIFIPTPGQTEQEYLARRLMEKGVALYMTQKDFNLAQALEKAKAFTGFSTLPPREGLLARAIDNILQYNTAP